MPESDDSVQAVKIEKDLEDCEYEVSVNQSNPVNGFRVHSTGNKMKHLS